MMYSILTSTNVPIVIQYVNYIIYWIKKKKTVIPVTSLENNTIVPPMNFKVIREEMKSSTTKMNKFEITAESRVSYIFQNNQLQSRYADDSSSPNCVNFKVSQPQF